MVDRNDFLAYIWNAYESGELLPTCAWCGRLCVEGQWLAPPPGTLSTIDERMTLSHSICPDCAAVEPLAHAGGARPVKSVDWPRPERKR